MSETGGMIRGAATSGVPQIRTLRRMVPGIWQPWWPEDTVAEAIRSSNGLAFVQEDDSEVPGFVRARDLGFRAWLSEWVAGTGIRSKGIAMPTHSTDCLVGGPRMPSFSGGGWSPETERRSYCPRPPEGIPLPPGGIPGIPGRAGGT